MMIKLFEFATRIRTPIALAGLVVMILYAVIRQMLKSGLFPPLDQSAGGRAVNMILKGLFALSIIAMVLGFAGYIVSLFAPPRPPANVATKGDVGALSNKVATAHELAATNAKLDQLLHLVADMRSTDKQTREKAESFLLTDG